MSHESIIIMSIAYLNSENFLKIVLNCVSVYLFIVYFLIDIIRVLRLLIVLLNFKLHCRPTKRKASLMDDVFLDLWKYYISCHLLRFFF